MEITLPDGSVAADDAALSAWLGRPVMLRSTEDVAERRYENPGDIETETEASWGPFQKAGGAFHDTQGATVTVLSTVSTGGDATRRFRANIVVEGQGEDALVGLSGSRTRPCHLIMGFRPRPERRACRVPKLGYGR